MVGAVIAPGGWGLTDLEKLGYLYAYGETNGQQGQAVVKQLIAAHGVRFNAEPTPQQLAAAQAAGQQIVDRIRAARQP